MAYGIEMILVLYKYDVFLAEIESFSMLRLGITNLYIFQHGTSEHSRKTSGLNDTQ